MATICKHGIAYQCIDCDLEVSKTKDNEIGKLRRELEDARSLLTNLGIRHDAERKRADELQKELEGARKNADMYEIASSVRLKSVHALQEALTAERERADLNEQLYLKEKRALELACNWGVAWCSGAPIWPKEREGFFRKLAQESK